MPCGWPKPSSGLRRTLVFVWLCFLARGVFYCVSLPLWEGFDEYAHFARVQHVAQSVRRTKCTVVGAVLNDF